MKLNYLSNEALHSNTKTIAERDRLTTIEILWRLRENERRMLYALMGYRDLKEYCVKELKYSEGSAWRRINAMRLLQEVPEVEEKLHAGKLNLTQISMAKTHFNEVSTNSDEKKEILSSLENKNTQATERILAELKPDNPRSYESERAIKGHRVELTLVLDEATIKDLEEIQKLLGKSLTKVELIQLTTRNMLEKLRQEKRKAQPQRSETASDENKISKVPSRYISKSIVKEVKARDQNRCQYRDPKTNKQCEAKQNLQIEHIHPFAMGGTSKVENLQCLCPTHNRLRAFQRYGVTKMQKFIPSLRG